VPDTRKRLLQGLAEKGFGGEQLAEMQRKGLDTNRRVGFCRQLSRSCRAPARRGKGLGLCHGLLEPLDDAGEGNHLLHLALPSIG
jgi:hypothetical protein